MLIDVKPDWARLEAMYAPMPDEQWNDIGMLPDGEDRQREILFRKFHEYAPRNLKIRDKAGRLIPLHMNRSQLFFHHCIEMQKRKTGRVRVICLKGRQWGGSTYTEARYYWDTTKRNGCNTFIFSHEDKSTTTLFEMVQRYHDNSNPRLKPITGKSNAKELVFPRLDSKYELATAGTKDVGRSKRVTNLHWSEMASSPNADGHKRGLLQTVPELDDTSIIKESTANGVGGTFHEDWLDAIKPETGWDEIAIFIPWYWHDEYRRRVPEGYQRTPEEEILATEFGLDDEQLSWRRWKIRTMKSAVGNKLDAFKQEYPMTWQEAFLYSGAPRFEPALMEEFKAKLQDPHITYQIEQREAPVGVETSFKTFLKKWKLIPDKEGPFQIWDRPIAGDKYVVGADVAKGLEHGDNSVAYVVSLRTGATVAAWAGKIPSADFGDLLSYIGGMYGRAEIIVEITGGYGDATVQRLQALHYPRIYQAVARTSDGRTKKVWGYDTTKNSKPILIDALDEDLIYEPHNLRDKMLWYEMSTFVRKFNDNNPHMPPKMEAMEGKHDDRVIARALASFLYHLRAGKIRVNPEARQRAAKRDEAVREQKKGQTLYRKFFSAEQEKSGPVKIVPAAEQTNLSDVETVEQIRAALRELKDNNPLKHYKPAPDVPVPEDPKPRRKRGLGEW